MAIIDVSSYNGKIDWGKVKDVDLAIIRCGYGKNIKKQDDKQFASNVEGALNNGIKVAVYIDSYATDEKSAINETEHVMRCIAPYSNDVSSVFIACEQEGTEENIAEVVNTFCDTMTEYGYNVGVRAPITWFDEYLNEVPNNKRWVVSWGDNNGEKGEEPEGYLFWQYTGKGKIDGINTDVNLSEGEFDDSVLSDVDDPMEGQIEIAEITEELPKEDNKPNYKGDYLVVPSAGLNVREDAGTQFNVVGVLPSKTKATCDGEYKLVSTQCWFKITAQVDKKTIVGYCNAKFLKAL